MRWRLACDRRLAADGTAPRRIVPRHSGTICENSFAMMKLSDMLIVAVAHLVGFALGLLVIVRFGVGEPEVSLLVGAVCGTLAGATLYERRDRDPSPIMAKAMVGLAMAAACIGEGLVMLVLGITLESPGVVIPVVTLGTFLIPFLAHGTFRRPTDPAKERR